jgi:predicted DNA-binding protein
MTLVPRTPTATSESRQLPIRLDVDLAERLEALVPYVTAQKGMPASRTVVLREAIVRGVAKMDLEKSPDIRPAATDAAGGPQLTVRLDVVMIERLDGLAQTSAMTDGTPVKRASVIREAIVRGLKQLEREAAK